MTKHLSRLLLLVVFSPFLAAGLVYEIAAAAFATGRWLAKELFAD